MGSYQKTAMIISNIGLVHYMKKDFKMALKIQQECLKMRQDIYKQ